MDYARLRHRRPRRVVGIGVGYSTFVALAALAQVRRATTTPHVVTAVDPFPQPFVDRGKEGLEIIEEKSTLWMRVVARP